MDAEPAFASFDDHLGHLHRLFAIDLQDYHGIGIDPINDPKRRGRVVDAQLMTARTNDWHRSALGKPQLFPALQQPKQVAGFNSGFRRKRRGLHLAAQPDDRLVRPGLLHLNGLPSAIHGMSHLT